MDYEFEVDGEFWEVAANVDVHEGEVRSIEVFLCRVYDTTVPTEPPRQSFDFAPTGVMSELERRVDEERQEIEELCRINAYDEAMDGRIAAYKDGGQ